MSTVFLHVGQCGNQLGQAFWQELEEWSSLSCKKQTTTRSTHTRPVAAAGATKGGADRLPFSLLDGSLPCILIDTEPKVVRRCTAAGLLSRRVARESVVSEQRGRGNNWAYGYYDHRKRQAPCPSVLCSGLEGKSVASRVRERMRRVVEKCDRFGGTVLLHSIAGGTGSGLSSSLLEHLREDYPLTYSISVAVAPFTFGESPLQHYNSLLCLAWLHSYSDAILLFQNDSTLEQVCNLASRRRATEHHKGSVSMDDMNKHISSALCNCFLPVWDAKQRCPRVSGREPWELVRSVCPDPASKFLTPVHVTATTTSWDQALSRLLHSTSTLQKKHTPQTKTCTGSALLVSRASPTNTDSLARNVSTYERKLKQVLNTASWNPFPVDYWFSYEPWLAERKASTLLVNSTAVASYLGSVHQRAGVMYREKAYLHWYERYGCERDTFKEAFETVQCIIDNYQSW